MARTSKLSAAEVHAAEIAADERRRTRATGFAKMKERDAAVHQLSNGVTMLWHVDREVGKKILSYTDESGKETEIVQYPPDIPEDGFVLRMPDGTQYLFNTEEFRQSLRWA